MLALKMNPSSGSAMGHTLPLYLHIQKLQEIICPSGQARRMAEEKRVFVKEQELPSQRPNIKKVDVKI